MSTDEVIWDPTEAVRAGANLTAFMIALGVPDYETLQQRADQEPEWFYNRLIEFVDFRFYHPYQQVIDEWEGLPHVRWCVGGKTNVVLNCIDRWMDTETESKNALV